jgi:OHCU decarboxylase
VVSRQAVEADTVNSITLDSPVSASHLKLDIIPDGGVARFRAFGTATPESAGARRLQYLNALLPQPLNHFLKTACAASKWVETMAAFRPFSSVAEVLDRAGEAFAVLDEPEWLEAFAGHPRIGERTDDVVAASEQAGAGGADQAVLQELSQVNLEYEARFGFTYIVYARGKGADEMLKIAQERLGNTREQEIENAAREQRSITTTRLRRMLCQEVDS